MTLTSFCISELLTYPFCIALDLSPDAVAAVLHFLGFDDVLALWLTGSVSLQLLLGSRGGWRVLEVLPEHFYGCIDCWPRLLLPELKGLRSLRINPSGHRRLLPLLKPRLLDLSSLSRFLTVFELGFVDAISDDSLDAFPPCLTRLWLPYNTQISHQGLLKLPRSLIILNLSSNRIIQDASKLPRDLCHYVAHPYALIPCETTFTGLPSALERLDITYADKIRNTDTPWTVFDISGFQTPGLRHLSLTVKIVLECADKELSHAWNFPPNLEALILYGDGCSHLSSSSIPHMPQSLTKLKLQPHRFASIDWSDKAISLLPRSLLHFIYMPSNKSDVLQKSIMYQHFCYRPAGVNYESTRRNPNIDLTGGLTMESFALLPRQLLTLRAFFKITSVIFQWQIYHPNLTRLAAHVPPYEPVVEDHMLTLPQSLSCLIIFFIRSDQQDHYRPVPIVAQQYSLPPNLKQFNGIIAKRGLDSPGQSEISGGRIPCFETLESISFEHSPYDDFYTTFPVTSGSIDDVIIHQHLRPQGMWGKNTRKMRICSSGPTLALLPKVMLTTLRINNSNLCDKDFLFLPDSLTDLSIRGPHGLVTDQCIPALPHDLLHLEFDATHVRGDVYPLPYKLQSFIMNHSKVHKTGSTFFSKDRPLESFKLANCLTSFKILYNMLPDSVFLHLPSRITKISVRNINGFVFSSLPRSLLILDGTTGDAFDDDIECLPRGLIHFSVSNLGSDLTDDSCGSWPPRLEYLSFGAWNLSDHGISQLPRTLQHLYARSTRYTTCTSLSDVNRLLGPHWKQAHIGILMQAPISRIVEY